MKEFKMTDHGADGLHGNTIGDFYLEIKPVPYIKPAPHDKPDPENKNEVRYSVYLKTSTNSNTSIFLAQFLFKEAAIDYCHNYHEFQMIRTIHRWDLLWHFHQLLNY